MQVKSLLILSLLFAFPLAQAKAQFYTIKGKVSQKSVMSMTPKGCFSRSTDSIPFPSNPSEDYFYSAQDSVNKVRNKQYEDSLTGEFFASTEGHEISIEKDIPVFVNVKDSLLFGLIKERMSMCLPLDYISVNSRYGFRRDPYSKCKTFHDGIDLQCNNQHVYSMLPGVVTKVVISNKGYGNHVIVDYGHIQVLYGHMAFITVNQGETVYAGTILGVSGNSGKSTGPHLHIKISAGKKSLDPAPFVAYLNRYITSLQDKIAYLRFGTRPPRELNIASLYEALARNKVMYPRIVIAQALLETGYFTSNVCLNMNNIFGLRRPSDGSYYQFDNWEESVKAYKDYVQCKYKGGDYFRFLQNIGYAEDPAYVSKVRSISNALSL